MEIFFRSDQGCIFPYITHSLTMLFFSATNEPHGSCLNDVSSYFYVCSKMFSFLKCLPTPQMVKWWQTPCVGLPGRQHQDMGRRVQQMRVDLPAGTRRIWRLLCQLLKKWKICPVLWQGEACCLILFIRTYVDLGISFYQNIFTSFSMWYKVFMKCFSINRISLSIRYFYALHLDS